MLRFYIRHRDSAPPPAPRPRLRWLLLLEHCSPLLNEHPSHKTPIPPCRQASVLLQVDVVDTTLLDRLRPLARVLGMLLTALPLVAVCLVVQACRSSYVHWALRQYYCLCLLRMRVDNALVRTTSGDVSVIFSPLTRCFRHFQSSYQCSGKGLSLGAYRALCARCAKSRPFSTTGRQFFGCRIAAGYYCRCVSL